MATDILKELQDNIGYHFKSPDLLKKALTHSSMESPYNYERLEFLGDRVLGLVMAHTLFETFRDENEGGLARRFSALVAGRTLAVLGSVNNLGEAVIMSDAEREAGGQENENIIADALEALLGAIYLDGGLEAAQSVIIKLWGDNIETLETAPLDPKTELQEWAQARGKPLPDYVILNKEGPDHAPVFDIEVRVDGEEPVSAEGPSRRQAEKTAARLMLSRLKGKKN